MIEAIADEQTYIEFELFDRNASAGITGAVIGDFVTAPVIKLLSHPSTTAIPTVTEIGDGWYCAVLATGLAAGDWLYYHTYDADNDWYERIHVLPAAADPAAIATAVAAVQTTVDGVAAMTDVATSTRAAESVWTSDRAERLDRIGADTVTVRSATAASALIELRQGADYTVSADTALEWDVTTTTDLSPVGTVVTLTISSRSLQGDDAITATCAVTNPAAATKTLAAELTDTQTARLRTSEFTRYQIDAQVGTDTVPLVEGRVKVLPALA